MKEIYDRFDRHPVTDSYADYSKIGHITIACSGDRYRLVAYPGRTILGLNIDITAPGGIFGSSAPEKVETSPNFGGLARVDPEEPLENAETTDTRRGTLSRPPAAENLILPGDPGFELFDQLHAQVGALKSVITKTVATTGITIEPAQLQMHGRTGIQMHDYATGSTKHVRSRNYEITSIDDYVFATELDGSVVAPQGVEPSSVPVFRAGNYSLDGQHPQSLALDSLVAFSGLEVAIQRLYT
jgi:hypothetical protein